ncbi:MAG: TonB-dependent receptor [Myxococcota bacterium]
MDLRRDGALTRAANRDPDPTYLGNQLPRLPLANGTFTAALAPLDPLPWQLGADLTVDAGTWADTANFARWPARALLGLTASVSDRRRRITAAIDLRNALDTLSRRVARDPLVDDGVRVPVPLVDYVGYPLPGRTVTVSVRLQGAGR